MYSFILPYKHAGDRTPIFKKVVERIHSLIQNDDRFEICIHESSPERLLTKDWVDEYKIRYLYSKWDEVFHRSWNLNISARYLATKDNFIFFDGDLLVDLTFIKELLKNKSQACWGWNKLHYLTANATNVFMETGELISDFRFSREPELWNCAGGINVINRDVFFATCGWPEDFRGFWGGPDNIMIDKMQKLCYQGPSLNVTAYHLNHEHTTHPNMESLEYLQQRERRAKIVESYIAFSKNDWIKYFEKTQGFGDISLGKDLFLRGIK